MKKIYTTIFNTFIFVTAFIASSGLSAADPQSLPKGVMITRDLRIGVMIDTVEKGLLESVWKEGGRAITDAGAKVIWGHFYADSDHVSWGNSQNPDLFVKIWLDAGGRVDVNFFHVSVPDIMVFSELPADGDYDFKDTLGMDDRYIRHEYWTTTPAPDESEFMQSDSGRNDSPDAEQGELEELFSGNTDFAVEVYQAISRNNENIIWSPHAVSLSLAMIYAGARNGTEQQMADTLHFTLPQDRLHPAFNALSQQLAGRNVTVNSSEEKEFGTNIANAIWGQTDYPFLSSFLDTLAENYGAGLRLLNFSDEPEDSRAVINKWICDKTGGKVKDLIPREAITNNTNLVLTNAIWFREEWLRPFPGDDTENSPFYLLNGTRVTTPMMSQTSYFNYMQGSGYQAAELRYKHDNLSMILLIPDPGEFVRFENNLSSSILEEISENFQSKYIHLRIPKFAYESGTVCLRDILSNRGMPAAFSRWTADFSGIDGTRNICIGDVLHKAIISVNESGTEAANGTAVLTPPISGSESPLEVTVNQPFIYFIRDIGTRTILFMGRMLCP
ncbi:serpin family protein [Desulfococcaceae bacterium HSG8]|nr:serpin family protein [Desulfococcaceae bacterium HSG8]